MKQLNDLPQVVERQLGGLTATPAMRLEIKQKATEGKRRVQWKLRPALALCAVAVLLLGVFGLPAVLPPNAATPNPLDSQSAGDGTETVTQEKNVRAMLDVPPGSVTIGGAEDAPAFRSTFAETNGSNFPLILLNGAAYRMLKSPKNVSGNLLGDGLGEVSEYTLEPALSSGGVVSNVVNQGETVYAIAGMQGAMVTAQVEGSQRVFQRVSFAGSALMGNESLSDVLCQAGDVISLELSDVGVMDDPQTAQILISTLLDCAEFQSASVSSSGEQSLLIGLSNGLTLQLMVSGDSVSACGTWSCPEFFESFLVMMQGE